MSLKARVVASVLTFVAGWEGLSLTVYKDIGGVPTWCYGQTGKNVPTEPFTEAQCKALLAKSLEPYAETVLKAIPNAPMKVQEAFTSFSYNVGQAGFLSSRALREARKGNWVEACRAMAYSPSGAPAWSFVTVDGKLKYVQGLHNRRKAEMNYCIGYKNA